MNLNQELSNAYPGFEPDEEARQSALTAIQIRKGQIIRKQRNRRTFVVATSAFAVGALSISFGPKAYGLYRLHQIEGAVSDAQTAEITVYSAQPSGKTAISARTLYDHGRWRMERGTSYQIWNSGKSWQVEPDLKRVTVKSAPEGPFTYNPSGFSAKAMIADLARWNWRDKIEVGSDEFEGIPVTRVTITQPGEKERLVLMADRNTSMPIAFLMQGNTPNGWHQSAVARASYDKPLDPALFAPKFDSSMPVVDLDKEKIAFLAGIEKPIKSFNWENRVVAIRVIDMNQNGDIFLMYSDGETKAQRQRDADAVLAFPHDGMPHKVVVPYVSHPSIEVTGSDGVAYLSCGSLQPYITGPSEKFAKGVVLRNGEVLEGLWLIPQNRLTGKSVAVTFNVSGNRFQWKFERPTTPLTPDWAPLMGMGPLNDEDVLLQELGTREPELERAKDNNGVIETVKAEIGLRHQMESKGIGPWAMGDLYVKMYRAYRDLGNHSEAIRWLKMASNEPSSPPEVVTFMKKEGL